MLTDVVIANQSYAKYKVPENTCVDKIALKVIKQDCPDFLLPMRTMEIDGEMELRYEMSKGTRLRYANLNMKKKDLAQLLQNMLLPFQNCGDWFLDYHNLLLDDNYILIEKDGATVRFVYLPVSEWVQDDRSIGDFFNNFLLMKVRVTDDSEYAMNLLRRFAEGDFNLMVLLEAIKQENVSDHVERYVEKSVGESRESLSGNPVKMERQKIEFAHGIEQPVNDRREREEKNHDEGSRPGTASGTSDQGGGNIIGGNLFGDGDEEEEKLPKAKKSNTGLMGKLFGKKDSNKVSHPAKEKDLKAEVGVGRKIPENKADDRTIPSGVQMDGNDGATEISGRKKVIDLNTLALRLEVSTGYGKVPQMIKLDLRSGSVTVGRKDKTGQSQADYDFDSSLTFISRRHFRVEKAKDGWLIIDLNSLNGTFVNGEALVANMPHSLRTGDTITLSQEDSTLTYRVC